MEAFNFEHQTLENQQHLSYTESDMAKCEERRNVILGMTPEKESVFGDARGLKKIEKKKRYAGKGRGGEEYL